MLRALLFSWTSLSLVWTTDNMWAAASMMTTLTALHLHKMSRSRSSLPGLHSLQQGQGDGVESMTGSRWTDVELVWS